MRQTVEGSGAVLRDYAARIAAAGPDVIARMEAGRRRRQAEWEEQMAEEAHRSRAARAARAFRGKRYAQVIELLEPLGPRLTPAERKQLALARKYLSLGTSPRA